MRDTAVSYPDTSLAADRGGDNLLAGTAERLKKTALLRTRRRRIVASSCEGVPITLKVWRFPVEVSCRTAPRCAFAQRYDCTGEIGCSVTPCIDRVTPCRSRVSRNTVPVAPPKAPAH
jgi:hypothetical protein